MAGVNLLKQLKSEEVVEKTAIMSAGGALSEVGTGDKIRIVLFLGGCLAFFAIRTHVTETYLPAKLVAPQQEIAQAQQQLAAINAKKSQLTDLERELQENDRRIGELKNKITIVKRIQSSNRDKVVRMVDYIVNQLPEPVWISELNIQAKTGSEIVLKGYSVTPQTISSFFSRLENGAFFSGWNLIDATREKITRPGRTEFDASRFELKAQVSEVP